MRWPFAKYVGCGNDFILLDNRLGDFPKDCPTIFSKLCHRQFGIGADGIIMLETSSQADCRMRIFNSDNSEAEMCGNGLRCFVKWIETLGYKKSHYLIETLYQPLLASIEDSLIQIEMGVPKETIWRIPLEFLGQSKEVHFLNTGVPHAILFVPDVESVPISAWGPAVRNHAQWDKQGANVNFVQCLSRQKLKIRTYERGVEGETLACGTGAVASALAAHYCFNANGPIYVETRSKEILEIDFSKDAGQLTSVRMKGPAQHVYDGEFDLASFRSL